MQKLKTKLKTNLKGAKKIAFLGVGSDIRGDDAAGILITENLKKIFKAEKNIKVFIGQTTPENLTGEIIKFSPTHVVILDAIDTNKKAGKIIFLDKNKIRGISFSTHRLPIRIMADYLNISIKCETIIIGIQPKLLDFCGKMSVPVKKSVDTITKLFKELANELF